MHLAGEVDNTVTFKIKDFAGVQQHFFKNHSERQSPTGEFQAYITAEIEKRNIKVLKLN